MPVKIDQNKCVKEHACPAAAACPMQALIQHKPDTCPVVDETKCISCGLCTTACPKGALSLE